MREKRIKISPGFLLLTALFLFMDWNGTAPAVLAAWAFHEGGHLAALYAAGGRLRRLELGLGGAKIETEKGRRLSYGGELLAVLAGPGVNLALAALCARLGEPWYLLSGASLVLGMFNLLPLPGLDGWRAMSLLRLLLAAEEKKWEKAKKK